MSSCGGSLLITNSICMIKISRNVLKKIDMNSLFNGKIKCNGVVMTSLFHCMLNIFEHELTHLIIRLFTNDINSHGSLFKQISGYFGHTKTYHELLSQSEAIHDKKLTKKDFNIGDVVKYKNKTDGVIMKLNPKFAVVKWNDKSLTKIRYCALEK